MLGLDSAWVLGRVQSMVVWKLGSGIRQSCFKPQPRTNALMMMCLLSRGFWVAFWEMLGLAQTEVINAAPRWI